eukprot:2309032-Lingulodinium_polyedra.AAC.1
MDRGHGCNGSLEAGLGFCVVQGLQVDAVRLPWGGRCRPSIFCPRELDPHCSVVDVAGAGVNPVPDLVSRDPCDVGGGHCN